MLKSCVISAGKTGEKGKTLTVEQDVAKSLIAMGKAQAVKLKIDAEKADSEAQDGASGE